MSFGAPRNLWLLLAVPAVWYVLRLAASRSARELSGLALRRLRSRGPAASAVALVPLALALALGQPRWGMEREEIFESGADVVLVLDTSGSMRVADVSPDRFEVARRFARAFVTALPAETRVGLVREEGVGELVAPLTLDHQAVLATINRMEPREANVSGSNLGDGIRVALDVLARRGERSGAVVLVSDGEDLAGHWSDSVEKAREAGVTVATALVGTTAGGPVPAREGGYLRDEAGRPVISRGRPDILETLARSTGGAFLAVSDFAASPHPLVERIRITGSSGRASRTVTRAADRSPWLLLVAALAWVVYLMQPVWRCARREL